MSSKTLLLIVVFVIVAAVSLYAHLTMGYVCPLPWPDESHFLWPAISLAEHGTLQAPELNPERTVYWMPPGYMVLMGGVFAVVGKSLAVARWFSLVCVLASFALLLRILRQLNFSAISAAFAGWFFCDAYFVAAGNIARMEALILLLSLLVMKLLIDNKLLSALGVSLFTLLIHPNGVYVVAAVVICTGVRWFKTKTRPKLDRPAIPTLVAAVIGWLSYLLWIVQDWSSYRLDMQYQLVRKFERKVLDLVPTWDNAALLILLVAAVLLCPKEYRRRFTLLWIAIPFWCMQILGHEMWYYMFLMVCTLVITALFIEGVLDQAKIRFQAINRVLRYAAVALILFGVAVWHYDRENLESPKHFPLRMQYFEMKVPDGVQYLTAADIQKVREIITAESARRPIVVQFFPRAEALFYLDLRSDRISLSDPLFCKRPADLYILHDSRYFAPRWQYFLSTDMRDAGMNPADRWSLTAFERDDHERWYVYRR